MSNVHCVWLVYVVLQRLPLRHFVGTVLHVAFSQYHMRICYYTACACWFVHLCGVSSSLLCIADVVWSCLVGNVSSGSEVG